MFAPTEPAPQAELDRLIRESRQREWRPIKQLATGLSG